jgi:hypothetical protein
MGGGISIHGTDLELALELWVNGDPSWGGWQTIAHF